MPPALVHDLEEPEEHAPVQGKRDTGLIANWRILAVTLYMGVALFQYGFDKGALAGFQSMPGFLMVFGYQTPEGKYHIQAGPQSMISSFMILGAFIGSLSTGVMGSRLCRRYCMMVSLVLMVISLIIMIVTTSFGALYFSRILVGIANGQLLTFTMVYLQETAPPHYRGLCFGLVTSWITIGTTIGMVINKFTTVIMSRLAYQIPLYVCFGSPVFLLVTLPFLPESPRWLLTHGRPDEAMKSLRFFRKGAYDEIALQQEYEEMQHIAEREAEHSRDWTLFFELFKGTNLRRTIICVGTGTANAGVGAMFILAFGTYFFQTAGVKDPFLWIIITNCVGLFGLIMTFFVVTRIGRRWLLLIGCAICTLTMLLMGIVYSVPSISNDSAGVALIVLVSVYVWAFNFGLEPYVYLVAGEMPAQNLRAYTMGLASGVSFAFAWACSFTTPYYINPTKLNWGPKYGYLWFGAGLIVTAFIYFMLPEARGRTLEEIDEMFRMKVPLRQWPSYVCVENLEARERGIQNVLGKERALGVTEHLEHVEEKK